MHSSDMAFLVVRRLRASNVSFYKNDQNDMEKAETSLWTRVSDEWCRWMDYDPTPFLRANPRWRLFDICGWVLIYIFGYTVTAAMAVKKLEWCS